MRTWCDEDEEADGHIGGGAREDEEDELEEDHKAPEGDEDVEEQAAVVVKEDASPALPPKKVRIVLAPSGTLVSSMVHAFQV